uniref:Uncharacterized protein n=1 Tax=Nelumbo nucifera TaxID=4432 RepID=A0A822XL51_NELNU|nr:TPA_asm: hypothetical protein HUJ06_022185 [Nelumbo nucifera]
MTPRASSTAPRTPTCSYPIFPGFSTVTCTSKLASKVKRRFPDVYVEGFSSTVVRRAMECGGNSSSWALVPRPPPRLRHLTPYLRAHSDLMMWHAHVNASNVA